MLPAKVGAVRHARALHELGQASRHVARHHEGALARVQPERGVVTVESCLHLVTMVTDHARNRLAGSKQRHRSLPGPMTEPSHRESHQHPVTARIPGSPPRHPESPIFRCPSDGENTRSSCVPLRREHLDWTASGANGPGLARAGGAWICTPTRLHPETSAAQTAESLTGPLGWRRPLAPVWMRSQSRTTTRLRAFPRCRTQRGRLRTHRFCFPAWRSGPAVAFTFLR